MNKYIHIDNTGKNVERVLSIINEEDIGFNPTGLNYILITDYVEPPELQTPLSKNYAMYDKVNGVFKWVPVQYQNTATEEILGIINLQLGLGQAENDIITTLEGVAIVFEENLALKDQLIAANADNITALEGIASLYEELITKGVI